MWSPSPKRALLILLLLTCAVYASSAANRFPMDDAGLAQSVDHLGQPDKVISQWHAPWWFFGQRYWEGVANESVLYRPVTILSYALTYHAVARWLPTEFEAVPHHVLNILLHAACVFLVWWMFKDLGADLWAVIVGSGVFAFNAIHSEVVAGIVGRAELFSFGFGLWAILLFVRGRFLASSALFFCAFCCKESGLAWAPFLPCFLFARDRLVAPDVDANWRGRWVTMAWVLGVGLVGFFALRHFALQGFVGGTTAYEHNPLAHLESGARVLNSLRLLGYGLYLCFAPFQLYCSYGAGAFSVIDSPADLGFVCSVVVLGGWLVLGLVCARRQPLLFLSAAMFLGFSFIGSNVLFAIGTNFGERLFYMPSLAISVLCVLLARHLVGSSRSVFGFALVVWCLACGVVISVRNLAWRDSETVFIGDAHRLPESGELQEKVGYLFVNSDPDKALEYFHAAVALAPDLADSWATIGRIHARRREFAKAEKFYKRALDTKYIAASNVEDRAIDGYLTSLAGQRKTTESFAFARDVVRRKPEHFGARVVYIDLGVGQMPPQEVYEVIAEGLRRHSGSLELTLREAMHRYDHRGDSPEENRYIAERLSWALDHMRPAARQKGVAARAQLYLGDVLDRSGQKQKALEVFRGVLKIRELPAEIRQSVMQAVKRLSK
jgi:tetratricopeptide (TPR) repeat protein